MRKTFNLSKIFTRTCINLSLCIWYNDSMKPNNHIQKNAIIHIQNENKCLVMILYDSYMLRSNNTNGAIISESIIDSSLSI